MGDRTTVILYVLIPHAEAVESLFDGVSGDRDEYETNFTCFTFYEVNNGELDFLEKLEAAGIPYDSCWCAGSEYGAGTKSCRFTADGEIIVKEIYDSESGVNIDTLISLVDDFSKLRDCILKYKADLVVLPWGNQEEYGKIYRTKQLITPK